MAYVMASSAAIVMEAGANVSSSAAGSDALLAQFSNNAEGLINVTARYDFIKLYPTASSGAQYLLTSAAAKLAAMDLIKYDMSSSPTRAEMEDRLNILDFMAEKNLKLLSEDKNRKFMIDGSTGVS